MTEWPGLSDAASLWRGFSMIRYWLTLSLLLTFTSAVAGAEVVYEGKSPSTKINLNSVMTGTSSLSDSILTLLQNEGYLDATVRSRNDSLIIRAGNQYSFDTLCIMGDTAMTLLPGVPFRAKQASEYFANALSIFRESGYLYPELTVQSVRKHEHGVAVEARANLGPLMRFQGLKLAGLKRTDPSLIRRYLTVDTLSPLTARKIDDLDRQARAIPFVTFLPPVKILPLPGFTGASAELDFIEPPQVSIEGGGGYLPGTASAVVWNLNLSFRNLFGSGRSISILSEKRDTRRQLLDISYSQPMFVIGKGLVSGRAATRDYRDEFYEFAVGAGYETSISSEFTAGLHLGGRTVEPSNDYRSYSSYSASFSIARSGVNDKLNPSSGLSGRWDIGFDFRSYSVDTSVSSAGQSSFNEVRNSISSDYYHPLAGGIVIRLGLGYRGLETAEEFPPLSELYFVGGPGTVRGYRNEQYSAVRTGFGTFEPRWRFGSGFLLLFYDGAYVNNRIKNADGSVGSQERYINGYGFGLAVVNTLRSINLSLGWNPDIPFDQPRLSIEISSSI